MFVTRNYNYEIVSMVGIMEKGKPSIRHEYFLFLPVAFYLSNLVTFFGAGNSDLIKVAC